MTWGVLITPNVSSITHPGSFGLAHSCTPVPTVVSGAAASV